MASPAAICRAPSPSVPPEGLDLRPGWSRTVALRGDRPGSEGAGSRGSECWAAAEAEHSARRDLAGYLVDRL